MTGIFNAYVPYDKPTHRNVTLHFDDDKDRYYVCDEDSDERVYFDSDNDTLEHVAECLGADIDWDADDVWDYIRDFVWEHRGCSWEDHGYFFESDMSLQTVVERE